MGLADRTHTFWQVFRAESPPGARLRRRVAATAAMVVFLLALLATVGFLRIALIAVAVVALVTGAAAILLVIGRYRAPLVGLGSVVVRRAASLGSSVAAAVARRTSRLVRSGSQAAVVARQRADACLPELRDGYVRAQAAVAQQIAAATTEVQRRVRAATTAVRAHSDACATRTTVARDREALRANAAGAQLRRVGAYLEAAEQHRVALGIFRELGDRRSAALSLNNLALALDRAGDSSALVLYEESASILGELGEEQQEGEVIANLALALRRRGSEERSAEVLEIALGKLNPESQAYRTVEGLSRAS